jgi:hypothetical protein
MNAQPNGTTQDAPDKQSKPVVPAHVPVAHEHVRTEGETGVDDALGAADDPS